MHLTLIITEYVPQGYTFYSGPRSHLMESIAHIDASISPPNTVSVDQPLVGHSEANQIQEVKGEVKLDQAKVGWFETVAASVNAGVESQLNQQSHLQFSLDKPKSHANMLNVNLRAAGHRSDPLAYQPFISTSTTTQPSVAYLGPQIKGSLTTGTMAPSVSALDVGPNFGLHALSTSSTSIVQQPHLITQGTSQTSTLNVAPLSNAQPTLIPVKFIAFTPPESANKPTETGMSLQNKLII